MTNTETNKAVDFNKKDNNVPKKHFDFISFQAIKK